MKQYSLYELNHLVKDSISESMAGEYWVKAELSECYEKGGHCYLELVEKGKKSNTFIAKARAIIWADSWGLLKYSFEKTTGQRLARGMQVLLQVYPNFHESFGFSWIVTDIDPTFTLGDIAKKRQEIIQQLKEEGVFDLNKQLPMPLFCQRIAVISSESAAGFGDFSNQLLNNLHGFHFAITLFPAIMQGEMVERSIIAALNDIYDNADSFDCVVIIRGGGASSDLTGFDTYPLAANVAQFPLPVITGIGHERDDTVLDLVSNTRVKTPTAAAEFLISRLEEISDYLEQAALRIKKASDITLRTSEQRLSTCTLRLNEAVRTTLEKQKQRLTIKSARLKEAAVLSLTQSKHRLNNSEQRLVSALPLLFERRRHRLDMITQRLESLDPKTLLKRGYSITTKDGKIVKDIEQVAPGDEIETILRNGRIKSKAFHN